MPWYRLITDARTVNAYAFAWRVKYVMITDISLTLRPCSLATVRDLDAAYHLVKYGGRTGIASIFMLWVTNHTRTGYIAKRSMQAGCGPGSCIVFCEKSLMVICAEGRVGRFSAAQFEQKVSNTGLSVLTDSVVTYASWRLKIDLGAFIDDFLNAVGVKPHAKCLGVTKGCPECLQALPAAQVSFHALNQMMLDCALVFSTKGNMSVAQRHVFLGVVIDTVAGRLVVTEAKFAKLMDLLQTCSALNMALLRCKAKHQLRCIEGVRPFLVLFDKFI